MEDKPPQNESMALIHWLSNWTFPYTQKSRQSTTEMEELRCGKKGEQERISNFLKHVGPVLIPCNILPAPTAAPWAIGAHYNATKYHLVLIFKEDMVHFLSCNS